jgi:hypothetical protein
MAEDRIILRRLRLRIFLSVVLVTMVCVVSILIIDFIENDHELFTFPYGFTGPVLIIYEQPSGAPAHFEEGTQIFEVPASGILLTQSEKPHGVGDDFWYRDEEGNRVSKLTFNQNCVTELPRDPVIVCVLAESLILEDQKPPRHSTFVVGLESEWRELTAGLFEWKRAILLTFLPE